MNFWETLERIGLVIMIFGLAVLGWLGWSSARQNIQLLQRLVVLEQQFNRLIGYFSLNQSQLPVSQSCDRDCVRQLVNEAVATISGLSLPTKQEVVERVVEKVTTSQPRSQYVPLGAGETSSLSWIDLPGAQVSFDIRDLGQVQRVYFEAQLQSPTAGLVYARLWDQRANNIIPGSEISHTAGDAQLISTPITVSTGGRTINIQLRSQNGQLVKVLNSRLRVDTN